MPTTSNKKLLKTVTRGLFRAVLAGGLTALAGCGDPPWNNPNPPYQDNLLTYQTVLSPAPPKHLDPAVSYASDESLFLMQIYEPPMGYHFLKRPYELEPVSLVDFPEVTFLDAAGEVVAEGDDGIAFTRYTLRIREDEHYQPHPAFARDAQGEPLYLFANAAEGEDYRSIADFPATGDRPVHANDYVYAIKRLADPLIGSPMLGLMAHTIGGSTEWTEQGGKVPRDVGSTLEAYSLEGFQVIVQRTRTITYRVRNHRLI